MTLIISMCTKEGIFMISDTRIIVEQDGKYQQEKENQKTCAFNSRVAVSNWGWVGDDNPDDLNNHLQIFKKNINEEDDINAVAQKLYYYCSKNIKLSIGEELGFHLAGFDGDGKPRLRHVFRDKYSYFNHFINEEANNEFHQDTPKGYIRLQKSIDYPILFNGDYKLVTLIINGLYAFGDAIEYQNFKPHQSKNFLKFLMEIAIQLQDFSSQSINLGHLIGYPLYLFELQPNVSITKDIIQPWHKIKDWNDKGDFVDIN